MIVVVVHVLVIVVARPLVTVYIVHTLVCLATWIDSCTGSRALKQPREGNKFSFFISLKMALLKAKETSWWP